MNIGATADNNKFYADKGAGTIGVLFLIYNIGCRA